MKKRLLLFVLMLVIVVSVYVLNQRAVLYVAPNGNDAATGTKLTPLRTLQKAADQATPGTTIWIRGGMYDEPLYVTTSDVHFKAYKQEAVYLDGRNAKSIDGNKAMITIHNQQDVTIEGLTVQNVTTTSPNDTMMGMYISGTARNITLKNNHVRAIKTAGNGHGIAFYGTGAMKNIEVVHNVLEDLELGASEALVLNGNIEHFTIANNTIRRSNNVGIDVIGYEGVAQTKHADFVREGTIANNMIYAISSYGNPAYGNEYSAGGIYVDGAKNITIAHNHIAHSDIGIEATSEHRGRNADNIRILHNEVRDNYYTGIAIGGYDAARGGTKNTIIAHNKLVNNDTKNLEGGQLLIQHHTQANRIDNNDFTASDSGLYIANVARTNRDTIVKDNHFDAERGLWIWKKQEYGTLAAFNKAVND